MADIYIVVATFVLIALILFVYKDEDLRFMEVRKKAEDAKEKSEED